MYSVFLCIKEDVSVQFKLSATNSFFKMSLNFFVSLEVQCAWNLHPFPISSHLFSTPDNSNLFLFPLKVRVIGSQLHNLRGSDHHDNVAFPKPIWEHSTLNAFILYPVNTTGRRLLEIMEKSFVF